MKTIIREFHPGRLVAVIRTPRLTTTNMRATALVNLVLRPASLQDLHSLPAEVPLGHYSHSGSGSVSACIHSYADRTHPGLLQHTKQMWTTAGMISDSVLGCICLELAVSFCRRPPGEVTAMVSRLLTCC